MKTVLIQRFTEEEQEFNTRLLSTFETMFSANSFNKLKGILHSEGTYFGKMNREKACGHFYNIFFGKDGCSEKFNMEVNKGISMDHIPRNNDNCYANLLYLHERLKKNIGRSTEFNP